ncbi:MAG: D-amino-acid transaminase [Reyranellaceae bacterium]
MSRIAYVNGRYLPHRGASVHIEDRGYQFADGVYEVIAVYRGRLVDEEGHLVRLDRSLRELRIQWPVAPSVLPVLMREVIARNRIRNGIVYLQITRGVSRREHAFPVAARPALVITARHQSLEHPKAKTGVDIVTVPDIRWQRRDIKAIALLPNVLAKQQAKEMGAYEAWQVDEDGFVTEGSSTNAWIVTRDGEIVTRDASNAILNGITRLAVIRLAKEAQMRIVERPFTVEEAQNAAEAFLTSTTSFVLPIVKIDGKEVGEGEPGRFATRLREYYTDWLEQVAAEAE